MYLKDSILGPLLFLFYINDLPNITNNKPKTFLFAEYTSIIITNPNPLALTNEIKKLFKDTND